MNLGDLRSIIFIIPISFRAVAPEGVTPHFHYMHSPHPGDIDEVRKNEGCEDEGYEDEGVLSEARKYQRAYYGKWIDLIVPQFMLF